MMESVMPVPVGQTGSPNIRLSLSNRPENVALVRQMLAGVAEAVGLDGNDLNDISTAATEACNNVVLHAYEGAEGPLEIDVHASSGDIEVVVRDRGGGIRPQLRSSQASSGIGLGLSVIQALTARAEFRDTEDEGTEVRMAFATPPAAMLASFPEDRFEMPAFVDGELDGAMEISIAPTTLARAVLPRLLSMLAARANFTTDRIADVQLVADALAAHVPDAVTGSHLSVRVRVEPRDLELRVAPLRAGRASELIADSALSDLAPVIQRLTDDQQVPTLDGSSQAETLALRLTDRR
jgi:serine/threonine-protein kinase RsbW